MPLMALARSVCLQAEVPSMRLLVMAMALVALFMSLRAGRLSMMGLRLLVALMPLLALACRVVKALVRGRAPIVAGVIIGMALVWAA